MASSKKSSDNQSQRGVDHSSGKLRGTHRRAIIVGGRRIPFVKSHSQYNHLSAKELMGQSLEGVVRAFHLEKKRLGEVVLGTLLKAPSDRGFARECVLGSSLDPHTPAFDIER